MNDEQDAVELMRKLASSYAFHVHYHEFALSNAHNKNGLCRALLRRANCDCDPDAALEYYKNDEDGGNMRTSEDLLLYIYGEALYSLSHHEKALIKAHREFAAMKSILRRGNFVEIDLVELEAEAKKRAST